MTAMSPGWLLRSTLPRRRSIRTVPVIPGALVCWREANFMTRSSCPTRAVILRGDTRDGSTR